jgi:hypothetical protein
MPPGHCKRASLHSSVSTMRQSAFATEQGYFDEYADGMAATAMLRKHNMSPAYEARSRLRRVLAAFRRARKIFRDSPRG